MEPGKPKKVTLGDMARAFVTPNDFGRSPAGDMTYFKIRSCTSKSSYGTFEHAEMHRKQMERKDYYHSYRCSFCTNWHIGKPMKGKHESHSLRAVYRS